MRTARRSRFAPVSAFRQCGVGGRSADANFYHITPKRLSRRSCEKSGPTPFDTMASLSKLRLLIAAHARPAPHTRQAESEGLPSVRRYSQALLLPTIRAPWCGLRSPVQAGADVRTPACGRMDGCRLPAMEREDHRDCGRLPRHRRRLFRDHRAFFARQRNVRLHGVQASSKLIPILFLLCKRSAQRHGGGD